MGMPDYLRTKSSSVKRAFGAGYLVVAAVITLLSWTLFGEGFRESFGLGADEIVQSSNTEIRGAVYLMVLPALLVALFTIQGLRMLVTGRAAGERRQTASAGNDAP